MHENTETSVSDPVFDRAAVNYKSARRSVEEQQSPSRFDEDVFDRAVASYREAREIITYLEEGPRDTDDPNVRRALEVMESIRDGLDAGTEVMKEFAATRDQILAFLYGYVPRLKTSRMANAAGYSDAYVSRVAKQHGMPRRTIRPCSSEDEVEPAVGEGG